MPPPGLTDKRPPIRPAPFQDRPTRNVPEGFRRVGRHASAADKAVATAGGLGRGVINSLPLVGGGIAALGGPELIPLGVGVGELARRGLTHIYDTTLDVPTLDELPPDLRPWAVGGEVFGGGIAPGAGPLVTTGRTGIRFLDRILQGARANPVTYGVAEGASNLGAGIGAGIGEGVSPGLGGQLTGGLVGGIAGSGTGIYGASQLARYGYNRLRQTTSTAAAQDRASTELRQLLAETGDDPAATAQALRRAAEEGRTGTSAQVADVPGLRLLEAELGQRSPQFAREAAQQSREALEGLRMAIGQLAASGDPRDLQDAARLRDVYFNGILTDRLKEAENRALMAAEQLGDTPAGRAELGRRTTEILDNALTQARAAERQLWQRIPGHAISPRKALVAEATRIAKEELLPEEGLPPLARAFVARVSRRPTNVREMLLFRSRMLESAREAAGRGEFKDARIYGQLAEATLDDLDGTLGADEARAFSRQLNDVFTRSFAGQATAETGQGARRIPPEVLLRRATGGPVELVDLRLNELNRAVRMGSPEAADELLAIQGNLIKIMADDLRDPTSGLLSPQRLSRFVRSNETILNQFPEVRETLRSVESANAFLQATKDSAQTARRQIGREAAFSRVANEENTVRAVDRILKGNSPEQQFRQLAILARRDSDAAVDGFRSAVMQHAYERAGGSTGDFSFTSFRNALLEPVRPGQASPLDMMRRYQIADGEFTGRLTRLLDQVATVETAIRTRPQLEHLLQNENALFDLALRVAGAKAGTAASHLGGGGTTGSTLIAASAGSRFARHIFNKIPIGRTQEVLIEAAKNPQFMAALLERPRNDAQRFTLARKINAWLVSLGLVGTYAERGDETHDIGAEQ